MYCNIAWKKYATFITVIFYFDAKLLYGDHAKNFIFMFDRDNKW